MITRKLRKRSVQALARGQRRIADAVRNQDPQAASRALADHIRQVSGALLRDAN
jgi:GntR family transcriptional repressor for pyruvate dehydrogenase complex